MPEKEYEFTVDEKDGDEWMQYAAGACSTKEEAESVAVHYAQQASPHNGMRVTVFKRDILAQYIVGG